jgi:NADPH:quinone reductase-like Zn-dependent oxidoreductase
MSNSIPESMQAIRLEEENGKLQVRELAVPEPGPGEVLVRMAASTINPSDIGFMYSTSGYSNRVLPVTPGNEGSGTVVAAGSGFLANFLLGKRVACARIGTRDGTWAGYLLTKASLCSPLRDEVSFESGATLVVNPMTALAFFEIFEKGRHVAFVNTAAASQLGRMLVRMAHKKGIPLINIVRRDEQADLLRSLGAEHVLVSKGADFDQKLKELAHRLRATLFLDAISGEFTQRLIDASPARSLILLYANLSQSPAKINPNSLWYFDRRVEGFILSTWAPKQGFLKILRLTRQVQKLAHTDLTTEIHKHIPFTSVQEGLELYQQNMTAGKILLVIDTDEIPLDK